MRTKSLEECGFKVYKEGEKRIVSKYETNWSLIIDKWLDLKVKLILKEMLKRPDLDWVENFAHDVLYSNNDLDYFIEKYNVEIYFEPIAMGCQYVNSASYEKERNIYKLYIRDDIKILKNINIKYLIQEIKEFIVHENTHKQQDKENISESNYYNDQDINKYLSQREEIAPMAHGIAYTLSSRTGLNDDEIVKAIANNDPILKTLPKKDQAVIDLYRQIGGKVWKLFLKKVYYFFVN